MDTNIHSNDPIVHDSPSPNFYPSSPSTIAEEVVDSSSPDFYPSSPSTIIDGDTPIPDDEWYFSDNSQDPVDNKLIDPSVRNIEYHDIQFVNDRIFHDGYHICKYDLDCQQFNFLCGNSFVNDFGNVKKCGYQCCFFSELPHDCRGEGYSFSSPNSNSHNAPVSSSSKSCNHSKSSWAKY